MENGTPNPSAENARADEGDGRTRFLAGRDRERPVMVALGGLIGLATFWGLDALSTEVDRTLNLGTPAPVLMIVVVAIAAIATTVLSPSATAMVSAGVLLLVGIAIGLFLNGGLRVPALGGDVLLVLLRGSFNPGIAALGAAWTVLGIAALARRRADGVRR